MKEQGDQQLIIISPWRHPAIVFLTRHMQLCNGSCMNRELIKILRFVSGDHISYLAEGRQTEIL